MIRASDSVFNSISWIPTGMASLDTILGGGIPTRRITEISGQFGVGKTTLALSLVANAQKEGYECLWADIEFSWHNDYANSLGVDTKKLWLIQERYAESAIDEIEEFCEKHKNSLIVVDAIGALLPRQEAEKGAEGKTIGGQANLVAKFCRKIVPLLAMHNNALIVLNHNFTDIMTGKIMTSGGAKLAYHKSIWLQLRKANKRIMKGEQQIGDVIIGEVRKNKLAATMKQEAEIHMIYGQGFSREMDALTKAIEKGVIEKRGQFFFMGGEKIARGMNALRELAKQESFAAKLQSAL